VHLPVTDHQHPSAIASSTRVIYVYFRLFCFHMETQVAV
jgi:hypothetical protein